MNFVIFTFHSIIYIHIMYVILYFFRQSVYIEVKIAIMSSLRLLGHVKVLHRSFNTSAVRQKALKNWERPSIDELGVPKVTTLIVKILIDKVHCRSHGSECLIVIRRSSMLSSQQELVCSLEQFSLLSTLSTSTLSQSS